MDKIKVEMKKALELFNISDYSRGVLVYHLIDIPLIKFPERIAAVREFYERKLEPFQSCIPPHEEWLTVSRTMEATLNDQVDNSRKFTLMSELGKYYSEIHADFFEAKRLLGLVAPSHKTPEDIEIRNTDFLKLLEKTRADKKEYDKKMLIAKA